MIDSCSKAVTVDSDPVMTLEGEGREDITVEGDSSSPVDIAGSVTSTSRVKSKMTFVNPIPSLQSIS
jgi:hypothetical protein